MPSRGVSPIWVNDADGAAYRDLSKRSGIPMRDLLRCLLRHSGQALVLQIKLDEAEKARQAAEERAHNWRTLSTSYEDKMRRQMALIDEAQDAAAKWKAECERHRSMTALDHVRAAVRKDRVATVLFVGAVVMIIAVARAVWGMI